VFREAEEGEEDFFLSENIQKNDIEALKDFANILLLSHKDRDLVLKARFLLKKEETLRQAMSLKLRKNAKTMNIYFYLKLSNEKDNEIVKLLYEKKKKEQETFIDFLNKKGMAYDENFKIK
jgi:hypothetical protein